MAMFSSAHPLFLVLLGPQGSGKGTQAEYLCDHFGLPTFSVGTLLREEVKKDTELGRKVSGFMKVGRLVPDEIVEIVVRARLSHPDARHGVILDGFPRDVAQAQVIDRVVKINGAIILDISDKESVRRLSNRLVCQTCGANYNKVTLLPVVSGRCDKDGSELIQRPDDKPKAIHERLKIYHAQTEPVIGYYEKAKVVVRVNGEQPIVEVHEEVVDKLKCVLGIEKKKIKSKRVKVAL